MTNIAIGIDMGGTKIEAVAMAMESEPVIVQRTRIATHAEKGYDALVRTVSSFIGDFCSAYPNVSTVGIGMPGSVDGSGRIKNANTQCLNGRFFRQELQQTTPLKLQFANDANCFALAEAVLGAGRGHAMVFGIIMGTGVGGGLVLDGAFRDGPHSICGEWGHSTLWPNHPHQCYCGKSGCVEQFISGPAVEQQYQNRTGRRLSLKEIVASEANGDTDAAACIETLLDNYGRAVSQLVNILDPDAIVLGGGVSNVDGLYTRGYEKLKNHVFGDECHTPVVRHQLGDSAGVLGAALMSRT